MADEMSLLKYDVSEIQHMSFLIHVCALVTKQNYISDQKNAKKKVRKYYKDKKRLIHRPNGQAGCGGSKGFSLIEAMKLTENKAMYNRIQVRYYLYLLP